MSNEEGSLHLTAHVLLQVPIASKLSMEKPACELMCYSLAPPPFLHDPCLTTNHEFRRKAF